MPPAGRGLFTHGQIDPGPHGVERGGGCPDFAGIALRGASPPRGDKPPQIPAARTDRRSVPRLDDRVRELSNEGECEGKNRRKGAMSFCLASGEDPGRRCEVRSPGPSRSLPGPRGAGSAPHQALRPAHEDASALPRSPGNPSVGAAFFFRVKGRRRRRATRAREPSRQGDRPCIGGRLRRPRAGSKKRRGFEGVTSASLCSRALARRPKRPCGPRPGQRRRGSPSRVRSPPARQAAATPLFGRWYFHPR